MSTTMRSTTMRPILDVATELGLDLEHLTTLGPHKAKLDPPGSPEARGRLVLVSALTPTKSGEGKTTVSVGLAMGLRRVGARTALALREPSLGPVFGVKGGGTGGDRAQVVPADDVNLHFTGDLHAVGAAHNLLAAMVDTDLYFKAPSGLARDRVTWPRVVDMNDRALRRVIVDAGGRAERAARFDITAASEVMAMLALAGSLDDLRTRLARTVVGWSDDGTAITADDLGATEAMLVLLREALRPNLVQTTEGGPALVHAGPFANIAHGCSSVLATRTGLHHADVVVTEAGFGFDLGGEKFLHLKAPQADVWPDAVVLVATVKALRAHGGGDLAAGLPHLERQLANVRAFGLAPVVAINVFADDDPADVARIRAAADAAGVSAAAVTAFVDGGAGGEDLARAVLETLEAAPTTHVPHALYPSDAPFTGKLEAIADTLYGAGGVVFTESAQRDLDALVAAGYGHLPPCVAKTPLSLTDDPKGGVFAEGHTLTISEVRLAAGAGFLVALAGNVFTMPGLPRDPAARHVRLEPDGRVLGLMQGD
ncbi:MAG: formate--tetrahydrofolate ligase [Trueperaceae bacterium]|nr:formate--tetrahydrofolate ligase [Trueperaceae bacterium]